MSLPGTWLWQRTMSDEMATHLERQTWDLLKVRANSNVAVRTWTAACQLGPVPPIV